MDKKVIWTNSAVQDLEQVADYIAKDSLNYASAFVEEVMLAARSLRQFSERGRAVPEFALDEIRELFVRHYRFIYQIKEKQIFIVGFIHGGRNLAVLWKREGR